MSENSKPVTFDVNLASVLFAIKHEMAAIQATGGGGIINMAFVFS